MCLNILNTTSPNLLLMVCWFKSRIEGGKVILIPRTPSKY